MIVAYGVGGKIVPRHCISSGSATAAVSNIDIRLLKQLFTPEEAEIALELRALPEALERIHERLKKTGISIDDLEKALDNLVKKGVIIGGKHYKKRGHNKYYSKSLSAIGI